MQTTAEQFDEYDAESSPRAKPLTYPGVWPQGSVLLAAQGVWPLRDREDATLAPGAAGDVGFRVGHCRVAVPEELREKLGLRELVNPFLVDVMERLNAVSSNVRVPVLAIGSNASPAQMRHKFLERDVSPIIPMMRATIAGLSVGFAPVVAPAGYVPATIVLRAGETTTLFIQWLDEAQLRLLDATETGYKRAYFPADGAGSHGIRATLDTGEVLEGLYAYVYSGGHLGDGGGPLVMGNPLDPRAGDRIFVDQAALLSRLLADSAELRQLMGETPEQWMGNNSPENRASVAEILNNQGVVVGTDFVDSLADTRSLPIRRYGNMNPVLPPNAGLAGVAPPLIARPTSGGVQRRGESVVRISAAAFAALGSPEHVEVRSRYLVQTRDGVAPRALAAVRVEGGDPVADDLVEVDHVIRMAVGLEIGEEALLRPVSVYRSGFPDLLFGRPNYVTMRVTLADPSTAERDVSLMSSLSLELLGVESGDRVVVEGHAGADGVVPVEALKAFHLPDDVAQDRHLVTNGSWGSRFPSARDALGVHPDIATLFLDGAARGRLGLSGQELTTVRVRPARGHQFGRELREIMLVLAIALLGVVGLVDNVWVVLALILGLTIATVALVIERMRRRLSHTATASRRPRARR